MIKIKIILAIFIVILLSPGHLKAEEILFKKDAVLKKISEALPSDWTICGSGENLIFERAGTVSVLFENKINAYMNGLKDRTQKIKTMGRPEKCRLVFRCEPLWPAGKLNKAKTANKERHEIIIKLPDHNTELYSLFLVSESGVEDEFHSVFPPEASQEAYQLKNIITGLCENR